jgi:Rhodopirellula transposase DDE domain
VLGRGGIAAVSRASGISENTIRKGIREIESGERLEGGRVRRRGGGRKPIGESDPGVFVALERLISYRVIINSIATTTTSTGLKVFARLDQHDYPKQVEVTDQQLAAVNLTRDPFHPEWNYTIAPSPNPKSRRLITNEP